MKQYGRSTPYFYILPHVACYVTFIVIPLFWGFYISCHRWSVFKGNEAYVGLKYYLRLLNFDFERGLQFWQAMWVTLQFVVYFVPPLVAISLGLALLVHNYKSTLMRAICQFSFLVPSAIAVSVVAVIWRWILSYDTGLVNYVLAGVGISRKPWLVDLPWAWITILIPTFWMASGWNMVLFLVGLQGIPEQLYDAAAVDGAGPWHRFWYITLPGLRPMMIFIVITQVIGAFGLFAQPQLLTRGGPGRETTPIMMHLFTEAFNPNYPRMGSSVAMGFVTGAIIFSIVGAIYLLFNRPADR